MILPIYLDPQPILRQQTKNVGLQEIKSDRFQQLLADMEETMRNADGIGLAAPQVGLNKSFTIIDGLAVDKANKKSLILINPRIKKSSFKKNSMEEGCLSIPGIYGYVKRPAKVTIEYLDNQGAKQKLKTENLLARVIQHEVDHLDGVLFTEKVTEYTYQKKETPKYPFVA